MLRVAIEIKQIFPIFLLNIIKNRIVFSNISITILITLCKNCCKYPKDKTPMLWAQKGQKKYSFNCSIKSKVFLQLRKITDTFYCSL